MVTLYSKDKQILIATIDTNINLLTPIEKVKKIDRLEKTKTESHGYISDLTTFDKISNARTDEHRWIKFENNSYYLAGVTRVFSDNLQAADFSVKTALGVI